MSEEFFELAFEIPLQVLPAQFKWDFVQWNKTKVEVTITGGDLEPPLTLTLPLELLMWVRQYGLTPDPKARGHR